MQTVPVKISFICVKVINHSHISGFVLSLYALKQRLETTLKIIVYSMFPQFLKIFKFSKITGLVGVLLTSSFTAFY